MKKQYKKILFNLFIILNILSLFNPFVCSADLSAGDIGDAVGAVVAATLPVAITMYLIDEGLELIEEYFNVDDYVENVTYKVQPPSVSIDFYPEVPVPGEKVTAFATPSLFSNPSNELFYTWMLKHNDGIDADAITEDDLEEYKINAARIIASGGFDWIEATKRGDYGGTNSDDDEDGYDARDFYGGNDQKGKDDSDYYCFAFNKKTGRFYPDDSDTADPTKHMENGHWRNNKLGFICEHLFPKECEGNDLGDGDFGKEEEKCWQTDPNDEDTSDSGVPDEATVLGLGVNTFSWIYQEGDVVGLAVEGASVNAIRSDNGAFKTMWAISGDGCAKDDDTNNDIQSVDDINEKCLPYSFIDLTDTAGRKFDVSLDFFPDFPSISTEDNEENSDLLSISASVSGESELGNLAYEWKVYGVEGDIPNPTEPGSYKLLNNDLKYATPLSGAAADTLKFGLIFEDVYKYLKISVTAKDSDSNSKGSAYTFIPLSSEKEKLKVYSVAIADDLSLSTPGPSGCENSNKICQVTHNEIIAIEASSNYKDFVWTIDKDTLFNPSGVGSERKIYFPVTKKTGEQFVLTMTATNEEGQKVVLKKTFAVMTPGIIISPESTDTCDYKLLGTFLNWDGSEGEKNFSTDTFEAKANSTVKLKADFLGPSMENLDNIQWTLPMNDINGETAQFTTGEEGDSYTISVNMLYGPSINLTRALYKHWGVYDNYYEREISANVYVDIVDIVNKDARTEQKPVASLFSGVSSYLLFLFKIILTVGLLIFFLRILSSLTFNRENQ